MSGACKTTPAQSYLLAKSTVGTVPMLCPYKIIFDGLIPYRILSAFHAACMSEYKFFSLGEPALAP